MLPLENTFSESINIKVHYPSSEQPLTEQLQLFGMVSAPSCSNDWLQIWVYVNPKHAEDQIIWTSPAGPLENIFGVRGTSNSHHPMFLCLKCICNCRHEPLPTYTDLTFHQGWTRTTNLPCHFVSDGPTTVITALTLVLLLTMLQCRLPTVGLPYNHTTQLCSN